MTAGKSLDANQRTLVAQDRDHQHPPLRETNATAHTAIGQRLGKLIRLAAEAGSAGRNGKTARRFPRTAP
jgi:hypothetical protein